MGVHRTKSLLAAGFMLGCLAAAGGCSSSGSPAASPAATSAGPAAKATSPAPSSTSSKGFQVSTPDGQVTLSLDGHLPPTWPKGFPVPPGAKVAGSGSVAGSSSATQVGVYTTSQSPADAFAFYKDSSTLTTSDEKSVGSGSHFIGTTKITAPHKGSVTVVSYSGTTYIVVVLTG